MSDFTDHWHIAYRKSGEECFHIVQNPSWAWAADPFLVKYEGTLYLFAELFLYKSERNGVLGYCKWSGNEFGEWTVTMDKHWHLSYPNVWVEGGQIHMIPESYQKEDVSHYVLKEFPDKWHRIEVMLDNDVYVDTTLLKDKGQELLFTFRPDFNEDGGELLLYKKENRKWKLYKHVTDDKSMARPGGNFFRKEGRIFRIAQDCREGYGHGLVFLEVDESYPDYREHVVRRIYPHDLPLDCDMIGREYIGVHTYNHVDGMEVIDLKYRMDLPEEHEAQKNVRKVFLNKYN